MKADNWEHCIRKISADGTVSTVAGSPSEASDHKDGMPLQARFSSPIGIAINSDGSIIVTEESCVRKISTDGQVSTLAGSPDADEPAHRDGAASQARFHEPAAVVVDTDNNIITADMGNKCVRQMSPDGMVSTLLGAMDDAAIKAKLRVPCCVAVDDCGNMLVGDGTYITHISRNDGTARTWAGSRDERGHRDGSATQARFRYINALCIDADGNVLVSDENHIRKITNTGLGRGTGVPRWPVGPPSITADFARLLDDDQFADATFEVEGTRFTAHRCILSARSDYFRGMLGSSCREADAGAVIQIKETTPAAFRVLLTYLYTGALELDDDVVIDVLRKAQEFDLVRVYNLCMHYCIAHVTPVNAIRWLIRAETCSLEELRGVVLSHVRRAFRSIRDEAPESLAELRAHPDLMLEVMVTAI